LELLRDEENADEPRNTPESPISTLTPEPAPPPTSPANTFEGCTAKALAKMERPPIEWEDLMTFWSACDSARSN